MNTPVKQWRRGLVVGKFCPLHRGHMLLIDSALAACDDVVIISYTNPEFAGCGAALREAWLRALYPQARVLVLGDARTPLPHNDAPAAEHREFCAALCVDVLGVTVDAVFTSEDYGDGFARSLSAFFDARRGPAPPVRHVCVDRARTLVPASGTAIRADPHAMRAFLHPLVYASFVRKVCVPGGESSGKTTLAAALAQELGSVWAPEYGRELWVEKNGALVVDDMRALYGAPWPAGAVPAAGAGPARNGQSRTAASTNSTFVVNCATHHTIRFRVNSYFWYHF